MMAGGAGLWQELRKLPGPESQPTSPPLSVGREGPGVSPRSPGRRPGWPKYHSTAQAQTG